MSSTVFERTATTQTAHAGFFVAGGTMPHDAPSYVERQADRDLYAALARSEFCYVLTSRQMGKSSLMVRTAARLRREGAAVAILDLTVIGQNLTPEQWYSGLLASLGEQIDREEDLWEFWHGHGHLSPLQRWMGAIRASLSPDARLVVFIDEIDAVRSLPFSTDEFFAAIRACYNRRSEDPDLHRLTFCLLGVATPSDLIQDTRTTPFNIGRRIELTDITEAEAAPLAQGLRGGTSPPTPLLPGEGCADDPATPPSLGGKGAGGLGSGRALLKRILYWTGGHPYLTQRLCQAVASDPSASSSRDVDRHCEALFLSPAAQERDDNLLFVRERLLRSEADLASALDLYRRVRNGRQVPMEDTNRLVSVLLLSGIVRPEPTRARLALEPIPVGQQHDR